MSVPYHIVIPARLDSTRLPGKVLADIGGKTMLEHVYLCATAIGGASGPQAAPCSVVIATDDTRVAEAAAGFGADVVMTGSDHASGTDRIAEVARARGWAPGQVVVNLQGDEPLMPASCLVQVAELLVSDPDADAASLYVKAADEGEWASPDVVKVVLDHRRRALYFSRSPVPWMQRWSDAEVVLRHIGLYAYRVSTLERFTASAPGALERSERLEQLRILAWGGRIAMAEACAPIPPGVDNADDLQRVRRAIESQARDG